MRTSRDSQIPDTWISLAGDFRAKTSALRETVWVLPAAVPDYGRRCIEWQCLSNADFGFDHRRERLYVIAYSDEVKRQAGWIQKRNQAQGIFVPPSIQHCGFALSQRVLEMPDREHIGVNDGIQGWTHRVGCLGNAVNPVVAKYLFECIVLFENNVRQ